LYEDHKVQHYAHSKPDETDLYALYEEMALFARKIFACEIDDGEEDSPDDYYYRHDRLKERTVQAPQRKYQCRDCKRYQPEQKTKQNNLKIIIHFIALPNNKFDFF